MAKSNIFVLPSKRESFRIVLIEALTCRLPIVATRCVGPNEVLEQGEYGLLVNTMDIEDLAEKMILLGMDKNLQKQFSDKAMERVKFFTTKNILNEWITLIEFFTKRKK